MSRVEGGQSKRSGGPQMLSSCSASIAAPAHSCRNLSPSGGGPNNLAHMDFSMIIWNAQSLFCARRVEGTHRPFHARAIEGATRAGDVAIWVARTLLRGATRVEVETVVLGQE